MSTKDFFTLVAPPMSGTRSGYDAPHFRRCFKLGKKFLQATTQPPAAKSLVRILI
jgi:hypothetical protein